MDSLNDLKSRAARAWAERDLWQRLYDEAYEYGIPYRRPSARVGRGQERVEKVFDNTAIVSAFRFAGQLQQDLFPPGQPFFKLRPSPIVAMQLPEDQTDELTRVLERVSDVLHMIFNGGEWDQATHEFCLDLAAGTAAMLIMPGDARRPVRFVTVPFDEVAIDLGGMNDIDGIFWRTAQSRRAIRQTWPEGKYPKGFEDEKDQGNEVTLHQQFTRRPGGVWDMTAYLDDSKEPIATAVYKTCPMIIGRYHRVPGEAYGRGPLLLNLPTIKTLNKTQEYTLKAAAVQLLGIWGYRAGGAFNPDTVRLQPGAFWPMSATGGVMGADVARLDVSAGRLDVGNLVLEDMRLQVQAGMYDDRIPDAGATPKSATEIVARQRRLQKSYIGAFSRLINELVAAVVQRVIEVAHRKGIIDKAIEIDPLLMQIEILSPLAAALRADHLTATTDFMQLVLMTEGPQALQVYFRPDVLTRVGHAMGVRAEDLNTAAEAAQVRQAMQQQAAAQQMVEAAPALTDMARAASEMEQPS
jgi:hypothetical protein